MPTPNSPLDANIWGTQLNTRTIASIDTFLYQTALSNIGTTPPTVPALAAGQAWIDTTNANAWKIQIYDGSTWVTTGTLNPNTHVYTPAGVNPSNMVIKTFSTPGTHTYTPSNRMRFCIVKMVGAGSSGTGSNSTGRFAGAGGGAGEYREGLFSITTIGSSRTVTVGAGGATGEDTILSGLMTAKGALAVPAEDDNGEWAVGTGASGGFGGTGGNTASRGEPGGNCFYHTSGRTFAIGGQGGSSVFGSGGRAVTAANGRPAINGQNGAFGAGGSGSIFGGAPGTGGNGKVVIYEYIE